MFKRTLFETLVARLDEPRGFMQVLIGPRQVGKTTLIRQALAAGTRASHYASADAAGGSGAIWIEQQWEVARQCVRAGGSAVLVLDEIQKLPDWSEAVKRLWDEDTMEERDVRVVLLGSSQLLVQKGLTESLAGRFEMLRVTHWSYPEMRDAFGFTLEQYIYFGGYPGAAGLIADEPRWRQYIRDAIVEATLSQDILMLNTILKPALLRNLFLCGMSHSGQILSFQKMTGQLQDAGNTTTLAHYLKLLEMAGLVRGLPKYSGSTLRQRASSPKLLALNTALVTAMTDASFSDWRGRPERWGRLVETAVGNHLHTATLDGLCTLSYWNDRQYEIDYALARGEKLTAFEVKSGRSPVSLPGIELFSRNHAVTRKILVGGGGVGLADFLASPATDWL